MISSNADFLGAYSVPNAQDLAPGATFTSDLGGKSTLLDWCRTKFEKEVLIMLLGFPLYKLLLVELDKQPFVPQTSAGVPPTANQIWIDLVNGKDEYLGLKELVIAYIFCQMIDIDEEKYTGAGTKKLNPPGTVIVSNRPKMVRAWRTFFKHSVGDYSLRYPTLFGLKTTVNYIDNGRGLGVIYGSLDTNFKSLYTFLEENKDVYPEWKPSYNIKNMNNYGI